MARLSPRTIRLALVLAAVAVPLVLVVLFWQVIVAGLVGLVGLRVVAHRAGVVRRRPRSSFATNVKALSIAYAAWNTRWLKPSRVTAKVHAGTPGTVSTGDGVIVADRHGPSDGIPY